MIPKDLAKMRQGEACNGGGRIELKDKKKNGKY